MEKKMEVQREEGKERVKGLLALLFWALLIFLITNYLNLSDDVEGVKESVSLYERRVKIMERWSEEIREAKRKGKVSFLGEIERIASRWGIVLDSARPEGDGRFEIRVRRVDAKSLAGFLVDVHNTFGGKIARLRISKSPGRDNLNDLEFTVVVK